MDNTQLASREEMGELRRDLEQFKSDVRQLRTDLSGLTTDVVRAAKSGAVETRERVGQTVRAAAVRGREAAQSVEKTVEKQVTTHPVASLATALGVGMVIGLGLARRG